MTTNMENIVYQKGLVKAASLAHQKNPNKTKKQRRSTAELRAALEYP